MFLKGRMWAENKGKKMLAIAITLMFFTAAVPLTQSRDVEANAILAPKTLDRINEPVVVLGSQVPDYVGYNEADIFVWAYRGGWQQVVFQIDPANGTWPFDNVHKRFGSDNNPGIFDNDDEICFMADETGDQVNAGLWAPGADTAIPRIEITAYDPNTGNMGWAYLFHHTAPPAWTPTSYVAWDEGTNSLTADNYTMDYPDADNHNAYFHDARVTPTGGGDNGQFIDREKMFSQWFYFIITNRICEQTWYTLWSGNDDDGRTSENSLTMGPVRIIRHWRMAFNPSQSTEWGEKKSFQVFYYRSHLNKLEHGKFWGSTRHDDDRNSIDHVSTTPAPQYWDSNGNTATINGVADDSITVTTPLDWYQVSSPHGSYIQTSEFSASTSPAMSMNFIDNSGANDNDGGRSGASPGKYGDISMDRMDLPSGVTLWDNDYHLYFLPADAPLQGSDYYLNASNPISTSYIPPVTQFIIGDANPPATTAGSVLIDGLSSYSVPVSAAGTIHLTANVDDAGRGDGNIMVANWTIGFANLPGTVMDASDGAYDEITEDVEDYIDISTWGAGTYELYVYGVDETGNQNTTSTEHATLTITDDVSPTTVPGTVLVEGLAFYSTPLSTAGPVDLTATIDDAGRGDSDIVSAVWTSGFANFPGTGMAAADGSFDSMTEGVTSSIPVQTWDAGIYDFYVYGTDAAAQQNTTSTEHATVQLIDDVAPDIQNVLVEGLPIFTVALSDAFYATVTAMVTDDLTGGSIIGGANLTIGQDNWPSSIPMNQDTPLDSDVETFTYQLDISSWLPGTYYVYVYGWDDVPNYNTAGAFATIIITNDASPEIKNVQLDGVKTLNVPFSARATVALTGTVDDWGHGDLVIGGANYTLGMANWPSSVPMSPVDVLDTPYENFTADIDISTWPVGTYDFYMYGWDIANDYNSSSIEHATLVIYDDVAPAVEDVLVDGVSFYETTLSTAGVVTLTTAVNDTTSGNSIIGGANYTVGEQNWPGSGMAPDTPLDTALETFSQPIDLSTWLPGVYDVYVYGWDNVPNYNDFSKEHVTIVIHDDLAPEVRNVLVNGSANFAVGTAQATNIILTATIDDVGHGSTVIGGANYTLEFVNWPTSQAMAAADGTFDSPTEDVTVTVDISAWLPGIYQFYVYAWDITPFYNVTSVAHGTLDITDDEPPAIYNFLVDGFKSITTDLDGIGTFTGIVSDEGRGDSIIGAGFFTDGYQNWNASFGMMNDTALDTANESFTGVVSFSNWTASTHTLFMYGVDNLAHANETSKENVTVTILDSRPPVTVDWSASLNGAFQVWVDPLVTPTVVLNATVTDELFGYSDIASANWTVGPANWSASHSMSPIDGGWDNYTEDVTAVIDVTGWPSGTYEIYVYGTDAFGNGQTATTTFCRLNVDSEPPETIGPWADGESPYVWLVDDSFQLTAYGDDRPHGNSIVAAAEYFIDWIGANGSGIPMSPIGFRFDSPYEGAKALVDFSGWAIGEYHNYYVHFKDDKDHWGECKSVLVMRKTEFGISVHTGWNLISVPLVTPTNNLTDILADLDGFWECSMTYDSGAWLSYSIHRPTSTNDFTLADNTIALWVYLNDADDGFLNVTGALPGPTAVDLYAGWNFVGYPTLNATATIAEALATITYNSVEGYSAVDPYRLQTLPNTYVMQPGEGYWINVPFDQTWVIDW